MSTRKNTTNIPYLLAVSALLVVSPAVAGTITENFDNVAGLTGSGWSIVNNSTAGGSSTWFQGNTSVFASQGGAANSYVAANLNATGDTGDISLWLISPVLMLTNGTVVSFWTRTEINPASFPDRLELRLSTNGASGNVGATTTSLGDFTALLVSINPALTTTGYPANWTQYTATISGLGGATSGRVAFRYNVTGSGASGANGNYIGIDTFAVTDVPEPSTWMTAGLSGLALLAAARARAAKN